MKRIVVKEIDKLKSTMYGDKVISEYLIYLILNQGGGDITLNGFTEYGEKNKKVKRIRKPKSATKKKVIRKQNSIFFNMN